MTITIYSTPMCPFCKMAKQFLTEKDVPFEEHDVAENEEKRKEMIQKSNQMSVPVIDVHGKILIGYDRDELEKALGEHHE